MTELEGGRPKKRAWGRTKNRGKGPPETETTESDVDMVGEPVKRIKLSNDEVANTQHSIDMQHPELMSDSVLVEALTNIKVPIPIYSDGRPSRERLIYLFKKHVIPRPQRTKDGSRFWKKQSGLNITVPMDTSSSEIEDWTADGGGHSDSNVSTIQRKRTLDDNTGDPLKKPSLQIPYKSLSKISMNDNCSTSSYTMEKDNSLANGETPLKTDKNVMSTVTTLAHSSSTSSKAKITWP